GHRCASPACRHMDIEIHHIIPWETCQTHDYENLIALCPNCHRRATKNEIDRKSLGIYKANLRFAHDKFSQFEIDILFELRRLPLGNPLQFPGILSLLIKRLVDAQYVSLNTNPHGTMEMLGVRINPDLLRLTHKGKAFLDSLETED
ncbi:MAG: HNH endonuclease signature motif containing protein, partial [Blastocatellia bacterium]